MAPPGPQQPQEGTGLTPSAVAERVSDLLKVTELLGGGAGSGSQAVRPRVWARRCHSTLPRVIGFEPRWAPSDTLNCATTAHRKAQILLLTPDLPIGTARGPWPHPILQTRKLRCKCQRQEVMWEGAIWGRRQCERQALPAGVTGTSHSSPRPGPAGPRPPSGGVCVWRGACSGLADFKAGRRKTLLLTESAAKESDAKRVPRALLTFNYYQL